MTSAIRLGEGEATVVAAADQAGGDEQAVEVVVGQRGRVEGLDERRDAGVDADRPGGDGRGDRLGERGEELLDVRERGGADREVDVGRLAGVRHLGLDVPVARGHLVADREGVAGRVGGQRDQRGVGDGDQAELRDRVDAGDDPVDGVEDVAGQLLVARRRRATAGPPRRRRAVRRTWSTGWSS